MSLKRKLLQMKDPKLTSAWLRVRDQDQIEVLLSEKHRTMLEPFFGRCSSTKEAAERAEVKLNVMYYHVKNFLRLGLLNVVEIKKDRGKQIKLYRSVSEKFFFSYDDMPAMTALEQSHSLNDPHYNLLIRAFVGSLSDADIAQDQELWGRRLERNEQGFLDMYTALDPHVNEAYDAHIHMQTEDIPVIMGLWNFLDLDHEDAKTFQHELFMLVEKYKDRQGAQRYITFLAAAPLK